MFGSKSFMNYKRKQLTPDLTPLIDVVFLLLIFFMVSTTFDDKAGMKIDLPKSKLGKIEEVNEKISVLISLTNEMKIKIDKEGGSNIINVTKDTLRENLTREIGLLEEKRVAILADRGIDYGQVIDIMSDIKLSGAEAIDIETKEK